jgi:hypothetical protein
MKASTLILCGSLVAAAALLSLFVGKVAHEKSGTGSPAEARAFADENSPRQTIGISVDPETWSKLQANELAGLFDRMCAAGISPAMARTLVTAQVHAHYAPQRAALNRSTLERPFWEPSTPDPETAAALSKLKKEEHETLDHLLGPAARLDESALRILRRQFPGFSETKIAAIQSYRQEMEERAQDLIEKLPKDSAIPAEWTALNKKKEEELTGLLTPREREDYELKTSNVAWNLRQRLAGFDPTEREFRALYQIQRAYGESAGHSAVYVDPSRPANDAEKQLVTQIQAALGKQRFADYLRSMDNDYQQTARLVARLELPPEMANQVYALQKEIQERAAAISSNATLTGEERAAQFGALNAAAEAKVTALLSLRGYEAYKQNGGAWMNQLQPTPGHRASR